MFARVAIGVLLSAAFSLALDPGCEWVEVKQTGLIGHNDRVLRGLTADQCKERCEQEDEFKCISIDSNGFYCALSSSNRCDATLALYPTYNYYEIKCDGDRCIDADCQLPSDAGTGRKSLRRWFYNETDCEIFTYTGDGGNANNFKTRRACRAVCYEYPALCSLPLDTGDHTGEEVTRYYYNAEIKKCRKFKYGGAGGNANRFDTKPECRFACK